MNIKIDFFYILYINLVKFQVICHQYVIMDRITPS